MLRVSQVGQHRRFRHVLGDTTLAIHPNYRRRGIGQNLFAQLFRVLAQADYAHVMRLELSTRASNQHALELFRKVGFQENARLHNRLVSARIVGANRRRDVKSQIGNRSSSAAGLLDRVYLHDFHLLTIPSADNAFRSNFSHDFDQPAAHARTRERHQDA
jgi:hypothetical protein